MSRVVFLIVIVSVAADASSAEIFVNNLFGDDQSQGSVSTTSASGHGPVKTITQAVRLAHQGDRIVLAKTDQPYRECITLSGPRNSGYQGAPFVIEGNGAVLDGTASIGDNTWMHVRGDVFRFRPRKMSFGLLYLDNVPAERGQTVMRLEARQWRKSDRHIYFRPTADSIPQDHDLTYTFHPVGITLYRVGHVQINNLTVQGFQIDGINAHEEVSHTVLSGLICRGNGRSGISVRGASRVDLVACLIGNNGTAQLRTEAVARVTLRNCDLIANTAPAIMNDGGQVESMDASNPQAALR